jgi:hypothetical protein
MHRSSRPKKTGIRFEATLIEPPSAGKPFSLPSGSFGERLNLFNRLGAKSCNTRFFSCRRHSRPMELDAPHADDFDH